MLDYFGRVDVFWSRAMSETINDDEMQVITRRIYDAKKIGRITLETIRNSVVLSQLGSMSLTDDELGAFIGRTVVRYLLEGLDSKQ